MSELTYERAKQLYTPYDEGQMRHLCALRDVEIDRLRDENAKLREQLDYVTPIAWYAASERERDRMRELGVEVDE